MKNQITISKLVVVMTLFFTLFSNGQTILDKLKIKTETQGLKYIADTQTELQMGGMSRWDVTLAPGKYKIFGLGGFSQVEDIDLIISNYDTDELIVKETDEEGGISILDVNMEKTTKVSIKIYNRKSSPRYEHYYCYILITKN